MLDLLIPEDLEVGTEAWARARLAAGIWFGTLPLLGLSLLYSAARVAYLVVILVLIFSLIESFFVLPAHLAHERDPAKSWRITNWVASWYIWCRHDQKDPSVWLCRWQWPRNAR